VGKVVTAYVLIQTEVGKAGQVAGAATEINGVQHAYPLTGPYDVIVRAEARNIDALANWSCRGSRPSTGSRAP
jgi:DNA-binding Lrp family transcriptional regulator